MMKSIVTAVADSKKGVKLLERKRNVDLREHIVPECLKRIVTQSR